MKKCNEGVESENIGRLCLLPSSLVMTFTTSLYGPAPTLVYALTRMEYSTYSSSPVRTTVSVEESTVMLLYIVAPLNVV